MLLSKYYVSQHYVCKNNKNFKKTKQNKKKEADNKLSKAKLINKILRVQLI